MRKFLLLFFVAVSCHFCNAQSFAIANDQLNILYIGMETPISVAVEGIPSSSISISVDDADVKKGSEPGKFIVTAKKLGACTITIKKKTTSGYKIIGSRPFRVKMPETPFAALAGKRMGTIKASVFKIQLGLALGVDGFDWAIPYKIKKFTFRVSRSCRTICSHINTGASFDDESKKIIEQVKFGDIILFEDIIAFNPKTGVEFSDVKKIELTIIE